jgi:hypothetical protein
MQQVQEEYYKVPDTNQNSQKPLQVQVQGDVPLINGLAANLLPPTPLQGELAKIPEGVKLALQELSRVKVGDGQEEADKGANTQGKKDGEAE